MFLFLQIEDVHGREILDSRGNPTVEAEVVVNRGGARYAGRASVPSGASTGSHEAMELRDKEMRYLGRGVRKAVQHVNEDLRQVLVGRNALEQVQIDELICRADGTPDKSELGANATLVVSMACAKAAANALHMPLFRYLGGIYTAKMPIPMMNILNGGKHADNTVDFQEFMIMPVGACCFSEGLRMGTEVYHHLKEILKKRGLSTGVGDEGGFAPDIEDARAAFLLLSEAVKAAGYEPGKDIAFAMDAAASELYSKESGQYMFPGESKARCEAFKKDLHREEDAQVYTELPDTMCTQIQRTAEEMIEYYEHLMDEFPLISIEDGLDENDWEGWKLMTARLGSRIQLVGDDLFVTNTDRLARGIQEGVANSILIKVNQIGTLTESFRAVVKAKQAGYTAVISHRSGETEDAMIADIAVALNTGQIKTGAPCRGERTAKYNELLRIQEMLDVDETTFDYRKKL